MKFALAFAFVGISLAVVSARMTCLNDESKCAEDECCIEVGNRLGSMWGVCLKRAQLGDECELHPEKSLIKSHVYTDSCPCAEGMKCVAKDGSKVLGTCQAY